MRAWLRSLSAALILVAFGATAAFPHSTRIPIAAKKTVLKLNGKEKKRKLLFKAQDPS